MGKISGKGRQGGRNQGSGFLRAELGSWLGGKDPPRQNLGGPTALPDLPDLPWSGQDCGTALGFGPFPGG